MAESSELEIINKYGFHVRPSTAFAQLAQSFASNIEIEIIGGAKVDAKNIMMLMTLGASKGAKVKIYASGADEDEAVGALGDLVNSSFGGIE